MRLPKTSVSYPSEIEELVIGKGDYAIGGARSPPFLDLDSAKHRRPVIFGEVFDTLDGYPESAASMFSGRQTDPEEWAVMWKELGADGVCLRLTDEDSVDLVRRIASRTRLPVMVFGDSKMLQEAASGVDDSILIIGCTDREQSLELSGKCGDHIVVAKCDGTSPQELCREMSARGARKIIVDLGMGLMSPVLKDLRRRMESYRLDGLNGIADSNHIIICDVTPSWDDHGPEVTARRASMHEATVALAVMMSGADIVVMKGPGAADMARVFGEELADL
jgi:CO dehydrogenase/acetyl-CoA synthase delta subunit